MKRCRSCLEEKETQHFVRNRARRDGLSNQCLVCSRAHDAIRDQQPKRLERQREKAKKIERNPEQGMAVAALRRGVATGHVLKWPVCAVPECSAEKVEAHHFDYSRPLDVVWLCRSCHMQAHALVRKQLSRTDHAR